MDHRHSASTAEIAGMGRSREISGRHWKQWQVDGNANIAVPPSSEASELTQLLYLMVPLLHDPIMAMTRDEGDVDDFVIEREGVSPSQ